MSQQDKLRNTLREYYDSQQFSPGENEWERAAAYLRAARRRRRLRAFGYISSALVIALFTGIWMYPQAGNDQQLASSISRGEIKSAPIPQATIHTEATSAGQVPQLKNKVKSNDKFQAIFPEEISPAKTAVSLPLLESKSIVTSQAMESGATAPGQISKDEPDIMMDLPENNETDALAPLNPPILVTADNHEVKGVSPPSKPEETIKNEYPSQVNTDGLARDDQGIPAKDNLPEAQNVLPETTSTLSLIGLTNEKSTKDTAGSIVSQPSPVDTMLLKAVVASADTVPKPAFQEMANEGIFYEAGASWLYGWKTPADIDARGFSPVLGINYMNSLTNRFALSFGVQYMQVRNLSASSKTSRESSYKYGEQSKVTVVAPATIHYLIVPLRFHYFADQRQSFGTGFNLGYLLNIDAKVKTYDEKPGSVSPPETVKLSGYTEGFSWFDSQVAFFYTRKIGRSLGVQAEVFLGLTDVKQDGFFGDSGKERNSGAKLVLVYYAFRKNGK